jgi:hypothetical protein
MPKSESVKRSPHLEAAPAQIERQQRHIDAMGPLDPETVDDIWVRSLHLFQDEGEIGVGLVTSRGTVTLLLGEARARELIAGLNELVEQCRSRADSDAP